MIALTLFAAGCALLAATVAGFMLDGRDEYERQSKRQLMRELGRYNDHGGRDR